MFSGSGPIPAGAPKRRLLDQVRDAIRRKHYSHRTQEAYLHWIKRFIYFTGKRHPAEMGAAEVTAFLNHLASERHVAAATQNQALSALLFLYRSEFVGVHRCSSAAKCFSALLLTPRRFYPPACCLRPAGIRIGGIRAHRCRAACAATP